MPAKARDDERDDLVGSALALLPGNDHVTPQGRKVSAFSPAGCRKVRGGCGKTRSLLAERSRLAAETDLEG
jgi:hypothetical protein